MADIVQVAQSNIMDFWRLRLNEVIQRINAIGEAIAITISGGSINNTTIGATTPSSGSFTNLSASSTVNLTGATLIISNDSISGDKISGGNIECNTTTITAVPTLANHATKKSYVDDEIDNESADLFRRIIIFGN